MKLKRNVALKVASSGITAIPLHRGRSTHRTLKFPLDSTSMKPQFATSKDEPHRPGEWRRETSMFGMNIPWHTREHLNPWIKHLKALNRIHIS